jgi:hypothetical protein
MKMSAKYGLEFKDYLMPIRLLEKSLLAAGLPVAFEAGISEGGDKWVSIYYGGRKQRVISIEGDNPAQAVKDIAAAVRL